jgi:hypothetical protein
MLRIIAAKDGSTLSFRTFNAGQHADGTALIDHDGKGVFLVSETDSVSGTQDRRDIVLRLIDPAGAELWNRRYAELYNTSARAITRTSDGDYVIAGSAATGSGTGDDVLLMKINRSGTARWIRTIGGARDERGESVLQTDKGDLFVAGSSCSRGIRGDCDMYGAFVDPDGTTIRELTYGGSGLDLASAAVADSSGGFILAGSTSSPERGAHGRDIHIVNVGGDGSERWNTTFGGMANEVVTGAVFAPGGSLVLTGSMTDPVDSSKRTLFLTHIGDGGREKPEGFRQAPQSVGSGGLLVRVQDAATGSGIPDARVYSNGKYSCSTSATEGSCILGDPSAARYSLRISAEGYRETTTAADPSQGSEITIRLNPSPLHVLHESGSPETSLDIVFVPSNVSYDCTLRQKIPAPQYTASPDTFAMDAKRLATMRLLVLDWYLNNPSGLGSGYQKGFNIYYYWDGISFADAFSGCAGALPAGFYNDAPFTDAAIILYPGYKGAGSDSSCEPAACTSGPGPGPQVRFKVAADKGMVFLHESGHALFGLMDTYCGQTYYAQNDPAPNIWNTEGNCTLQARKTGWNASQCRLIEGGKAGCRKDFWKYDVDPDLMAGTGPSAVFGEASVLRMKYVLDTIRDGVKS